MTPTEKLIAEARELDRRATPGPWVYNVTELSIDTQGENSAVVYALTDGQGYPMVSVHDNDAQFIVRSRTLIPALCDALEQAQSTLEQTWEWDMYKAAQKEIERLRKELAAYEDTGKTPEQIAERTKAQQELKDMLDDLISVGNNDGAETYTTGYRNGYRNGRIELLKYILQIPDGTCEAAEAALKERE